MKNHIKGMLFRLPAAMLLLAGFLGSLIIKLNSKLSSQYPISWGVVAIFAVLLVLYIIGERLSFKERYPY